MTEESWEEYRPEHREGLTSLVHDVHAEFGFADDPVLDADLDDPSAHDTCILLVTRGSSVLGSAALTEPPAHTARITRMYL